MEASFFEGSIKGEVKYNVFVSNENKEKVQIVFAANWIDNRRVQDIHLFEEKNFNESEAKNLKSQHISTIK